MNISELKENPLNEKIYGESDIKELVDRIDSSKYVKAILIKPDNTIISGHRRVAACKELGIVDIDAEVISGKTDLEYEELFLLENDNRVKTNSQTTSEYIMWKEIEAKQAAIRKLSTLKQNSTDVEETSTSVDPVEVSSTGSSREQNTGTEKGRARDLAAARFGRTGRSMQADLKVLNAVKELPKEEQKVVIDIFNKNISDAKKLVEMTDDKRKDVLSVIEAGEAKNVKEAKQKVEKKVKQEKAKVAPINSNIINGEAVEELKKLSDNSVDCVVTDPPYGISYKDSRESYTGTYKDSEDYALKLLEDTCKELKRVCKEGSHMYFFTGYSNMFAFKEILDKYFYVQENPIVWVKNNHTMGDFKKMYASKCEYIWFCSNGKEVTRSLNNACSPDVVNFAIPTKKEHSAQKPIELLTYLIENSTEENETVIDPFAGSGSTIIASKQVNRQYIGIEVEQGHYETMLSRFNG